MFYPVPQLISYGATIRSIRTPDRDRKLADVTLGFDNMAGYLGKTGGNPYLGCTVGRVANRIGALSCQLAHITLMCCILIKFSFIYSMWFANLDFKSISKSLARPVNTYKSAENANL